jgi:CHAT domain-containing protein
MHFNARLAVLSACKTGYGKIVKGEGMQCLARGFMYAGCPSLIMTMWEINDKSGSGLMKNFYEYLSKGKAKDEALQQSKLDYLKNADNIKSNPYYWAGYINFGNHEALFEKPTKANSINYYSAFAFIVPAFFVFLYRKNIYKKVEILFS